MTESIWINNGGEVVAESGNTNRLKFAVGGMMLLAAVGFLVFSAVNGNTQLYKTVDEFHAEQTRLTGRDLRVAGMVMGDSIEFTQIDATTSRLEFDIADDASNPGQRLHVVAINEPMPDLLQQDAQALVEGRADENGVFQANPGGLLLKCPTRYEELDPTGHPDEVAQ